MGSSCSSSAKVGAKPGPPTRSVNCGKPTIGTNGWNPACGGTPVDCYDVKPGQGNVQEAAFATQTYRNGRWQTGQAACPNDAPPMPTDAQIRAQAFRLLPAVGVGSAWRDTTLVNVQEILWADAPTTRALPTVNIVGQQVAIQIGDAQTHWSFGDGTSDTAGLGKAYDPTNDPCRARQCPDYYGHTYRTTGSMTVTLQVSWHVRYRIGAGAWTDLPGGALTGPASRHALTVKQARGVLVASH